VPCGRSFGHREIHQPWHTLQMIVLAVAVQIARVVWHPIEDLIDTTFILENLTLSNAEQRRQG
jgi:hypothetical protein